MHGISSSHLTELFSLVQVRCSDFCSYHNNRSAGIFCLSLVYMLLLCISFANLDFSFKANILPVSRKILRYEKEPMQRGP